MTTTPPASNFASETIWTGDNLAILRGMNSGCVDLIYLDPPFNSNRTYEAPIGSKAAGAAFKDAWTLDDVDVHEHGELADRNPAAYSVIEAARQAHGKGDAVVPHHDGRPVARNAAAAQINRLALSPLRPDSQPLFEAAYGRDFRTGECQE